MVVIDTNIIIDHVRQGGHGPTTLLKLAMKFGQDFLGLSVVSIQELYEGKSSANTARERELRNIISPLRILGYNYTVAKVAGTLIRDGYMPNSLADAAIAATALLNSAQLATLNVKDFRNVPELQLIDLSSLKQ